MSKQTASPLHYFRHQHCHSCSYHDACLSDKSIELHCLLAAILSAFEKGQKAAYGIGFHSNSMARRRRHVDG